ncbi:MAG: hypothetical protein M3N12_07530 [Verrucomicrobiota bacterium]|nr:hypothetical protein [Verrucomicrobiota bacterium]
MSAVGFFAAGDFALAGNPVGDFFKRLGNSIAHPRSTPTPTPKPSRKSSVQIKQNTTQPITPLTPPDAPAVASQTTTPMQTPTPVPARVAATAAPSKSKRDLPYGIPVPGKPGFVTSPFSPKLGYVDVRGFPSGTEVKDPYSGKVFLTP